MHIKGQKVIQASPMASYRLLTDPDVLVGSMPGLKSMQKIDEGRFEVEMEMGLATFRGRYSGMLCIEDVVENVSYRMVMMGEGPTGSVAIDLAVRFQESDKGTKVCYEGDAAIGGAPGGMGQRVMSGATSLVMNQFFNNIARAARRAG